MHVIVIVIAFALVGFGAFTQVNQNDTSGEESVLGDTPSPSITETTTPSATNTPDETSTPTHTPKQSTQTPTPTQHQSGTTTGTGIAAFALPGAKISYQDGSAINLESTDDSDAITDWYKNKIESLGYNAKSFVKTKTNGNVKNSLVGADGKTEIRVEITKAPGENATKIFVTLKTT